MNTNNSWKDGIDGFHRQKIINEKELSHESLYPTHWTNFLQHLSLINNKIIYIYDLGCGIGAYAQLIHKYYPHIKYIGYDFAPEAIKIAQECYTDINSKFICNDIMNLTNNDFQNNSLIIANGLCNTFYNGDIVLEYLLKLQTKYISLQRIVTTFESSYYEEYQAYSDIKSLRYYYNHLNLLKIISINNYKIIQQQQWEHPSMKIYDILLENVEI